MTPDGLRDDYSAVWLVDFEFQALPGERPIPLCLVAREFFTDRMLRVWLDDDESLKGSNGLPFDVGAQSLYVAYYASAEFGCHIAQDWPLPVNVLDLFCEFRNLTNGRSTLCGSGLLGALAHFGLPAIGAGEKTEFRELAMRGGPYTETERLALLDYCQTDVDALKLLLPAMLPAIDMPRALLRGRYMNAAARMEWSGISIDADTLTRMRPQWELIQTKLVERVNQNYGVYVPRDRKPLNPESAFGRAVIGEARAWELDPDDVAEAAEHVWQMEREASEAYYSAKREARQVTGLTTAKLNRWEDSGRDCSTWPRLDETARELAGRFPELGIGPGFDMNAGYDAHDYAGALWDVLREPEDRPRPKHHPDIVAEAAELVARSGTSEAWRPMRFSAERWASYLTANDIPWPRLMSGALALDDETFREMARRYPEQVAPIRELRHSLGQLRLNDLAVGCQHSAAGLDAINRATRSSSSGRLPGCEV
jgi:hypothetical protein